MTQSYHDIQLKADDEYRHFSLGPGDGALNGRTIAMLDAADQRLSFVMTVSQGSYMGANQAAASSGTHSGGGAIDISTQGHTREEIDQIVLALRETGFAAWHRELTPGVWPDHVHAVAIGDKDLSPEAAGQVEAYRMGGDGLVGDAPDNGPRVDIHSFDYQAAIDGTALAPGGLTGLGNAFDPEPGSPIADPTDHDHDGITNEFESLLGTDPHTADTDHDHLSDAVETLQTHTNPLIANDPHVVAHLLAHPDTATAHPARIPLAALQAGFGAGATLDHDHDGLSDLTEAKAGSDPYNADTDHDQLGDGVEYRLGASLTSIDTDHDGITDNLEYDAGTLAPTPTPTPIPDPEPDPAAGLDTHT